MTAYTIASPQTPITPPDPQERLRLANIVLRRAGDRLDLLRELSEEARVAADAAIVEHQAALDAWVEYLKGAATEGTKESP